MGIRTPGYLLKWALNCDECSLMLLRGASVSCGYASACYAT
jgi:hypothetical protein